MLTYRVSAAVSAGSPCALGTMPWKPAYAAATGVKTFMTNNNGLAGESCILQLTGRKGQGPLFHMVLMLAAESFCAVVVHSDCNCKLER
jgi:hypothetical protein